MNNNISLNTGETGISAKTVIGLRTKDFSICLRKAEGMIYDAQIMIVTINPQKQPTLQPLLITRQMLAAGVFQSSVSVDKNMATTLATIYKKLSSVIAPEPHTNPISNLDLLGIITGNNLQKGDILILLSIRADGEQMQKTLARLRGAILLAPCMLEHNRKKLEPWLFPWFLTAKNLEFLGQEISNYFQERNLPQATHKLAVTVMKDLYEEQSKHRQIPITPYKKPLKWGAGIY